MVAEQDVIRVQAEASGGDFGMLSGFMEYLDALPNEALRKQGGRFSRKELWLQAVGQQDPGYRMMFDWIAGEEARVISRQRRIKAAVVGGLGIVAVSVAVAKWFSRRKEQVD